MTNPLLITDLVLRDASQSLLATRVRVEDMLVRANYDVFDLNGKFSADTITDEEGERFYRIRVRTTDSTLDNAGDTLPIIPGMTTQVDILTGKKTVMDYLLKPILRAQQNALRER